MKKNLRRLTVLILINIAILISNGLAESHNWRVEIDLAETTFVSLEPIWLDITLTNISADTQRTHGLAEPNHRLFYIYLYHASGESVDYTGPSILFAATPGRLLLDPGEQDYGSFDLTQLFFSHEVESGYSVDWRLKYIPKGRYVVRVWFDRAISNPLSFEIIEPHGQTAEVLAIMEDALEASGHENRAPSVPYYRQVVKRYPDSPFAEVCYYLSVYNAHWREYADGSRDRQQLPRQLLERYPNSGDSDAWLYALTREKNNDEKLALLNEILEKHPNTRCCRFAEQMRRRTIREKPE